MPFDPLVDGNLTFHVLLSRNLTREEVAFTPTIVEGVGPFAGNFVKSVNAVEPVSGGVDIFVTLSKPSPTTPLRGDHIQAFQIGIADGLKEAFSIEASGPLAGGVSVGVVSDAELYTSFTDKVGRGLDRADIASGGKVVATGEAINAAVKPIGGAVSGLLEGIGATGRNLPVLIGLIAVGGGLLGFYLLTKKT